MSRYTGPDRRKTPHPGGLLDWRLTLEHEWEADSRRRKTGRDVPDDEPDAVRRPTETETRSDVVDVKNRT
jgi:hypothetical protein